MTGFWRWLYNGLKHAVTLGYFLDSESSAILRGILAIFGTLGFITFAAGFAYSRCILGVVGCVGIAGLTFTYTIYLIVEES